MTSKLEIDCADPKYYYNPSRGSSVQSPQYNIFNDIFKSTPRFSYSNLEYISEYLLDVSEDMLYTYDDEASEYYQDEIESQIHSLKKIGCINPELETRRVLDKYKMYSGRALTYPESCPANQEEAIAEATIDTLNNGLKILEESEVDSSDVPGSSCDIIEFNNQIVGDEEYIYKCISSSKAQACRINTGDVLNEFDIPIDHELNLICSNDFFNELINIGVGCYCGLEDELPEETLVSLAEVIYEIEEVSGISSSSDINNLIVEIAKKEWEKWDRGAKDECETDMQDELKNYWNSVNIQNYNCANDPWSAAFTSYIMEQSGITNFPANLAHAKYFRAIRDDNTDYGCKTYPMSDIDKLKEGDLICRNRDGKTPDYNDISNATHCDIITELTRDSTGTITLRKQIGGNRANIKPLMCSEGNSSHGCTVYQSTHRTAPSSSDYFGFISCQETEEEEITTQSTRAEARNCDGLNNRLGLLFDSEEKDVCNTYTNCYTDEKKILFTTRHKCVECTELVDCNNIYNLDQYGFNICEDSTLMCGI